MIRSLSVPLIQKTVTLLQRHVVDRRLTPLPSPFGCDVARAPKFEPPSPGLPPLTIERFRQNIQNLKNNLPQGQDGFFPRDGITAEIMGHNVNLVTGLTPIFLELAHYGVGFSIAERSSFAKHPILRGIMTFMSTGAIIYGSVEEAEKMAEFLFRMHSRIKGKNPREVPNLPVSEYNANDPASVLWVFATFFSTLDAHRLILGRDFSPEELEQFYQEVKPFGILFGVPEEIIPGSYLEFEAYYQAMLESSAIWVSPEAKETAGLILENMLGPAQVFFRALTAATLPPEIRSDFGLAWDDKVEKEARLAILLARTVFGVLPERLQRTPMESVARVRRGEADRTDIVVKNLLEFVYQKAKAARKKGDG